jgi:hypothetical protein
VDAPKSRAPVVTRPVESATDARAARTGAAREQVVAVDRPPWWLRIIAWLIAIPLGLALVAYPARKLGYLSSQRLLDVLIGEGVNRYVPLVVIVLLWALMTALLVQCIAEGGGWLLRRRRAARAAEV